MNCFEYCVATLQEDELFVAKDNNIKLYDGHNKTNYENGELVLTSHRLFWGAPGDIEIGKTVLGLHLSFIISLEDEITSSFLFEKKKRLILNLKKPSANKMPGPLDNSTSTFIKLSGREGINTQFVRSLNETIAAKIWNVSCETDSVDKDRSSRNIKLRAGIVGIERNFFEKQKQIDQNINLAFKDLSKLMTMAQDMVAVSKIISTKIRERQGEISEDETVQFKSYLMSLGIEDPVTRDSSESNSEYFTKLANELSTVLLDPIINSGGIMTLADVYCRINRARGLELLSPEDLFHACKLLKSPINLSQFSSGAMVLQLDTHDDEAIAKEILTQVQAAESLTAEELSNLMGLSVILTQDQLLIAERMGKICRDESIEGLRFYPNLLQG